MTLSKNQVRRIKESQGRRPAPKSRRAFPVALRMYRGDGELADRGTASVRELSRSRAILGDFGLSREIVPLFPHLIGIRFKSGRLGPVELAARALEFAFRPEGMILIIEFFECQDATLALFRRTVQRRMKGLPPSTAGDGEKNA
jgi:hypothetical protein